MKDTILVTPVQVKRAATKAEATEAMKVLRGFVCREQLAAITSAMRSEERQFFFDKAVEMANTIETMPVTYQTDGQGDEAIVHLHYFYGEFDWYITERDMLPEQFQAFGLAKMWEEELGYISIVELCANRAELDLYWTPKHLKHIKQGGRE
jgi:hypothetical protein